MLHYGHQLAPNLVCLQFGAGQVAYSGFHQSEIFYWKQLSVTSGNRINESTKQYSCRTETQINELKDAKMLLRG